MGTEIARAIGKARAGFSTSPALVVSFSYPEYSQTAIPSPPTNADSGPLSGLTNGTNGLNCHLSRPMTVRPRNGKKMSVVRTTEVAPTGRMPRQFVYTVTQITATAMIQFQKCDRSGIQ